MNTEIKTTKKTVITEYNPPPVPNAKAYYWIAYRYNWDIGDPSGYGSTEQQAINDLIESEKERT